MFPQVLKIWVAWLCKLVSLYVTWCKNEALKTLHFKLKAFISSVSKTWKYTTYAAVNCKTHYRTPRNSASWMGHLPHISEERYRLGSLWSVTTLTNECVNDGHFTWVRPFPMTYDTVVGGIEKSRHAKCVRSAWPVCIDSVARCGSSTTCASMELARCGCSATCASMELQSFPCV